MPTTWVNELDIEKGNNYIMDERKYKVWWAVMSKLEAKVNQKIPQLMRSLLSYHKWNNFPKRKMILEFGQT